MRLDLLIASASDGVLVYGGRLLAPTARLRPEDIIAYRFVPGLTYSAGPDPSGGGMAPWPVFPENDIVLRIRDVLDGKVGFDLLVYGTIGSVLTVVAGAVALSWNVPLALDVASAPAALALGYSAGWWWTARSGWYDRRARRLLVLCFLAWLEREVGDPKAKHQEFGLTVVSTARKSGFTLMKGLQPPSGPHSQRRTTRPQRGGSSPSPASTVINSDATTSASGPAKWRAKGPDPFSAGRKSVERQELEENTAALYQLEVKLGLAKSAFPAAEGWRLTMHVDPMEIGKGGTHPPGKVERVTAAQRELQELRVVIGPHKQFGRVDVVAEHDQGALRLIEVEGESSRQKEQAVYSALGQLLMSMKLWGAGVGYGIAVPDTREWVMQVKKIPTEVTTRLHLWRYLVKSTNSVTIIEPGSEMPDWARG